MVLLTILEDGYIIIIIHKSNYFKDNMHSITKKDNLILKRPN